MLNGNERKVLEIINNKLLITRTELRKILEEDGIEDCIQFLKDNGFIEIIQPAGETCVAITQKGMRAVRN